MRPARLVCGLVSVAYALTLDAALASASPLPRLVIAHHMNAEPPVKAGGQDTFGCNTPTPPRIRPESDWAQVGGRVRDRAISNLYNAGNRSLPDQAAWEIAVARRAGVDAFAFYGGVPGGEGRVMEYMRAAKGTGFKITFCSHGERGRRQPEAVASLRRLIEADRDLDVLLRVDGKLLLLTYGGLWGNSVEEMIAKRREFEAQIGTPMLVMYMPLAVTAHGPNLHRPERWPEVYAAERERLGKLLQGGFDGLSPFLVTSSDQAEADARFWGDVCREHGKMYFAPINFQYQKPQGSHAPVADSIWRRAWSVAHAGAAGVQLITWNDWGETTSLAPGVNANYGLYDLLREEAAAFKAGKAPEIAVDQAWALYYRYPSDAEPRLYHPPSPRKFRGPEHDYIWVITSLTAPATVICEGRGEREAPAGRSMVSFPLTPGPVRIVITRDGKTIQTVSPPEVVTDQPWRPDDSLAAFASDEKERAYREADFPGQAPRYGSEYGDDDGDGLFNWFEGLFFSSLDQPATGVGPKDNLNGIPLARAQREFLDPVMPPPHYPNGFVWAPRTMPEFSGATIPDEKGIPVWEFGYRKAGSDQTIRPTHAGGQRDTWRWGLRYAEDFPRLQAWHGLRMDGRIEMASGAEVSPELRWVSPVSGRVRVRADFRSEQAVFQVSLRGDKAPAADWEGTVGNDGETRVERELDVEPGDRLRLFCRAERPGKELQSLCLGLEIELLASRMPILPGDPVDPPVSVDLARWDKHFASALCAGRYRWGEAGLRRETNGLAIFHPGGRNVDEMLAFYDTVPNATYGPLCRWGDVEVKADIRFEYGDQPPKTWGEPAFALTTRIAPQRRAMYFLRIEVPSRQADPANPTAALRLGWMFRAYGEPPREEVIAETSLPLPQDGSFRLVLASQTGEPVDDSGDDSGLRSKPNRPPFSSPFSSTDSSAPPHPAPAPLPDDTVRLTGVATWPDGSQRRILTGARTMSKDGTTPWGEVGFAARLPEISDTTESPRRLLLRSFAIGPAEREAGK
jgi:hypothetical protein